MKITRQFYKIIIILIMIISLASCHNNNNNDKDAKIEFTLSDDGTYYILASVGDYQETEYIIPDEYNGLPVKQIGRRAFYKCNYLEKVIIGANITSIRVEAFYECISLKEIFIPNTVLNIQTNSFPNCFEIEIYCEAESPLEGWEDNWNSDQNVHYGHLVTIPEPDEETIRVKALFEQKYAAINKYFNDNYSKEYYISHLETRIVEKKIKGNYYYDKSTIADDLMVHTANYYEKINDKFVALYKVYDNSYETSSKEKAFQFEVLLQDFNYKELRYDVTDMFSPAAVYREVDGQIIIEDNISRLKFEYYYDDPFAQIGLFGDYGKIKFVFNFSDTGVEGYVETESESQKFSFKFNKINPDEEFNIDNEKEHGTEGDILYLKQYLILNEQYAIPKLDYSFYDFKDKYFKVKLSPGYYVCEAKEFEILNKDLEVIELDCTTLLKNDNNGNTHYGFAIDKEIDGYLLLKAENITGSIFKFALNQLERAPETKPEVEFEIGETVNVTNMITYDVAKFTATCEPNTTYLVETSEGQIYINGKYYSNSSFITTGNVDEMDVKVTHRNLSFKITKFDSDDPESSLIDPIPLTSDFDKEYSLIKKEEFEFFSFNVDTTGYCLIQIDCDEHINLYLYHDDELCEIKEQSENIWSCNILEPGEYVIELEKDYYVPFCKYRIKYTFSPDLDENLTVDYTDSNKVNYEFNTTKHPQTKHRYNFIINEDTKLYIDSSLGGYRVLKKSSDITYTSLFKGEEDIVYLNPGTYQIVYYSSKSEDNYSLKLSFVSESIVSDTFSCIDIEFGKEYSFDFTKQKYYLLKLTYEEELCYKWEGNVKTFYCVSIAYAFGREMVINDDMWYGYRYDEDYFYVIVMKDQVEEGSLIVTSKVSGA